MDRPKLIRTWRLSRTDNCVLSTEYSLFSRNPSSSNKTRTADTSTCIGSRATSSSSSDNIVPDLPLSTPVCCRPLTRYWRRRLFRTHVHRTVSRVAAGSASADLDSAANSIIGAFSPIASRRSITRFHGSSAPAVRHDPPRAQSPPYLHVLSALRDHRSIRLPQHDGKAPDLHRHVARVFHPRRFQTQIAVSSLAQSAAANAPPAFVRGPPRGEAPSARRRSRTALPPDRSFQC